MIVTTLQESTGNVRMFVYKVRYISPFNGLGRSRSVLIAPYKPTILYNFIVSDMQMLHRTVCESDVWCSGGHSVVKVEDIASTVQLLRDKYFIVCVISVVASTPTKIWKGNISVTL